jgi:ferric-dicitrate binding protein FerR (iron transport regulator)
MHCTDKLELYLLEALEPKDASEVKEHLAACPPCASEMKRVRTLVGALHGVHDAYEKGAELREVRKVRAWKPWAVTAAFVAAAIPAAIWALRTPPAAPPPPVAVQPAAPQEKKIDVDSDTHMTLSSESVYEISTEKRVLTLTEGTLECEIGGSSFTLNLPNGRVIGKAYKISAKVEKDKITVKILQGTALFIDDKGKRHIVIGGRTVIQTVNGVTRVFSSSFSK